MHNQLSIFADLTLTCDGRSIHAKGDGQRIFLSSTSLLSLWKILKTHQFQQSWTNQLDEVLRAGKLSIYVNMGLFSIPLIGFRSWKWLRKIFTQN